MQLATNKEVADLSRKVILDEPPRGYIFGLSLSERNPSSSGSAASFASVKGKYLPAIFDELDLVERLGTRGQELMTSRLEVCQVPEHGNMIRSLPKGLDEPELTSKGNPTQHDSLS